MRILWICSFGLTTAACGLSMNPDLPFTESGFGSDDNDNSGESTSGGDIGLDSDGVGAGATNGVPTTDSQGGASHTCVVMGGAGGAGGACGALR
jgi:hypothetical protein